MELNVNELKNEVFDYLDKEIKSTPQSFKNLIDGISEFNKKCNADLAIWASVIFDGWGSFRHIEIKMSDGIPDANDINYVILSKNTIEEYRGTSNNIHNFILNYLEEKYPLFNEDIEDYDDEFIDNLYEELCKLFKEDEKFELYKRNYYYMRLAKRMKERIEEIIEWENVADKVEEIHPLSVYHNKSLIISFGVKYKFD